MKNNFKFTLPDFQNDSFEFENNIFSGKSTLKQNGNILEQSKEKGKPFLIKTSNGEVVKAFPKTNLPDISSQVLNINGVKYPMAKKLKWYEYVLGGLPILVIFSGGVIGGAIGGAATVVNYTFLREENASANKYLKVIAVNAACLLLFLFLAGFIYHFIN